MNSTELTALLVQRNLPEYMYAAVRSYVLEHKPVGHFLMSLFRNDLAAFMRADPTNRACFEGWIYLLYWDLPSACWGSKEKVNLWLEKRKGVARGQVSGRLHEAAKRLRGVGQ